MVLGSRHRSGRQDRVPQSPDPSSPKSTPTQLRTQMSTLSTARRRYGPSTPKLPPHTRSEEYLPPDSPPAATPTLAALCSWLVPHPLRTELVKKRVVVFKPRGLELWL